MELTEFLLAQVAEDEAVAWAAVRWSEGAAEWGDAGEPDWIHIARWDPARVLAECESKRAILGTRQSFIAVAQTADNLNTKLTASGAVAAIDALLPYLAQPYASHPDYDPAWRP